MRGASLGASCCIASFSSRLLFLTILLSLLLSCSTSSLSSTSPHPSRAKQRGWLEVDILLGTWAHRHVPSLSSSHLDLFEDLVNMDSIDLYNILTLRQPMPEDMDNEVTRGIVEWVEKNPLKGGPEDYKTVKMEAGLT